MQTTQSECIEALREAADILGKPPTKAEYENLNVTPSSTTIIRIVGGWNEAKEMADVETFEQGENGGQDIESKPDWVELPESAEWEELTAQQRWYYKHREYRIELKESRRRNLKEWFYKLKRDEFTCSRCAETRPPALDFHHDGQKDADVSEMVNSGYSRSRIREEIERCDVLCANCHRKEHYEGPDPTAAPDRTQIESEIDAASKHEARKLRRRWLVAYKHESDGCENCTTASPVCLDFHHEQEKTARVGKMVSFGSSLAEIQREIQKCVLLCANCHRQEHFDPPTADSETAGRLRQS